MLIKVCEASLLQPRIVAPVQYVQVLTVPAAKATSHSLLHTLFGALLNYVELYTRSRH